MGVRGLKTFMDNNGLIRSVDVEQEIENWKKNHPNQQPIICIEINSLILQDMVDMQAESLCGGRHQQLLDIFDGLFSRLVSIGAKLVFFRGSRKPITDKNKWAKGRDESFVLNKQIYDSIEAGDSVHNVVANINDIFGQKPILSTKWLLAIIAKKYGDLQYSIYTDNDIALASYANENEALAVVANDTDLVIFNGKWKLWSAMDFNIPKLTTREFDRDGFLQKCHLQRHQLPLLATLMGNDFTNIFYEGKLTRFHRQFLKGRQNKFVKVARYIRNIGNSELTDADVDKIVRDVFGCDNQSNKKSLIRKSIKSYELGNPKREITDPMEMKLFQLNPKFFNMYKAHTKPIQGISMRFYDMRGCRNNEKTLPSFFVAWLKRRIGIVCDHENAKEFTFTLVAKQSYESNFRITAETPIYPDISVPPLDQLMLSDHDNENEMEGHEEINITRWKLFGWILSIAEDKIEEIRDLPNDLVLICVTLYVLVKNSLLSVDEADGILLAEQTVLEKLQSGDRVDAKLPTSLITKYVRAAHIYNMTHKHIRNSLEIVGLTSSISTILRFDGVYFQNMMNLLADGHINQNYFIENIKKGRIYVNN